MKRARHLKMETVQVETMYKYMWICDTKYNIVLIPKVQVMVLSKFSQSIRLFLSAFLVQSLCITIS